MFYRKRPFIVFMLMVALPGVALVIMGLRTLRQERISADQEIRDWLYLAADKSEQDVNREFSWWMDGLHKLPPWSQIEIAHLPERLQAALEESQGSMLIRLNGNSIETIPNGGLLYSLGQLVEFSEIEMGSHKPKTSSRVPDNRRADAPGSASPLKNETSRQLQLWKLHETGAQLRRDGRISDAVAAYEKLKQYPQDLLGPLPSGLVADFEICSLYDEARKMEALGKSALALYTALVQGRWRLEKVRYRYYAASARAWMRAAGRIDELNKLNSREDRRFELTKAIEGLAAWTGVSPPDDNGTSKVLKTGEEFGLALMHRSGNQGPVVTLFLSPATLERQLWPRVFPKGITEKWNARLTSSNGMLLYSSDPRVNPVQPNAVRSIRVPGDAWTLDVWPKESARLHSDLRLRQRIYISILVLFAVSLAFAFYFSARMLFQELEVARMKANFVSTVSHEFRTPLTGIRQLAEMLAAGRVPGDQRRSQYYSMILREADHLARMVENILAFARATEKRAPFRMETIDTNRWLRGVVSQFQQSPAGSKANVLIDDFGPLLPIRGDPDALSLVLTNLIDNAIKYSPENAPVRIAAETSDGSVLIRVRDEGIGISEEDRNHIFERFYRGRGSAVQRVRGTGLGLSLVRDIVSAHQGNIRVESCPGTGSTFTVSLAVTQAVENGEPL